jgi:hypothetical protein
VFANKAVFQTYGFHFTFALTEVHTAFTLLGMIIMSRMGFFESKRLPTGSLMQLAAAYVGYIVLCNLSLKVNTVGFYQVMKIAGEAGPLQSAEPRTLFLPPLGSQLWPAASPHTPVPPLSSLPCSSASQSPQLSSP